MFVSFWPPNIDCKASDMIRLLASFPKFCCSFCLSNIWSSFVYIIPTMPRKDWLRKINIFACTMQVDPQRYAFAMKKNSSWADKINRMINIALLNGVLTNSYENHLQFNCPAQQNDNNSIRALSLKNLGGIFTFVLVASIFPIPLKTCRRLTTRKRPKFPLRSLATQQVCYPTPSSSQMPDKRGPMHSCSITNPTGCTLQNTPVVRIENRNMFGII